MPNLEGFGQRLTAARELKRLSQQKLADLTGLSRSAIQSYERGSTRPKMGVLSKLATVLECNGYWLMGGEEHQNKMSATMQTVIKPFQAVAGQFSTVADKFQAFVAECSPLNAPGEYAQVPLVRAQASAGGGFALEDYDDEALDYVAFRRNWLAMRGNPKNFKLMEVSGDSMEPIICDSDLVLLDFSRTKPRPGKIFAVAFDGYIYLKRLFAEPGRLILRSENKVHADVVVDLEDSHQADRVTIIGQAICWFHSEMV